MRKQLFWHTKPRTSHNEYPACAIFTLVLSPLYSFWRQRSNPDHSLNEEDDVNNSDEDEDSKEPGVPGSSNEIHTGEFNSFYDTAFFE